MLSLEEICEWWERKNNNYLNNYVRRNRFTFAEEKSHFFTKTHKKFFEAIPKKIKKYIDKPAHK
jgi:hypothetical protein